MSTESMMEDFTAPPNSTSAENDDGELRITYVVCEIIVALFAVIGNFLVILVFYRERRLRRRTNYYIVSLAIADLLVGLLGIPFAILASIGLPRNLYGCLFTVSLLVVLCTTSIFCLVAVSVDRYWAILHPMGYSRNVRTKTAIGIIGVCWASGSLVGFLPLLGWHNGDGTEVKCLFTKVMDYNYLVFLYFGTIIIPAVVMAGFYAHIYRVVLKQVRRIVTMNPAGSGRPTTGGGTMLRVLGAAQKREVKATQNLSIIVLFFIICWIPLYTINCIQAFCTSCAIPLELTNFCIILSHLNSAINPLLYAYHLRDFQAALKNLICCFLRVKSDEEINNTRGNFTVGRCGSHNTLHHQGVHTPTRNNSIQSLHQSRIQHSTQCTDSTIVSSRLSPTRNTLVNSIMSSMNSIGSLPLGEDQRKRMWTLAEVSSVSEEEGRHSVELRGENRGRKGQEEWSSGQINSAYIEEGVALDYDEDDDVFIPEPITALSVIDLKNRNRTSGNYSDVSKSEITESNLQFELCIRHSRSKSVGEQDDRSVENESRFGNQSESPLIVEIEKNNKSVDDNEKTELADCDFRKKPTIVTREGRNCKDRTRNTELVNNNSEELTKSNASQNNQRLSPLKMVGEFLFPSNNKKNNRIIEETSVNSCKSETTLLESLDAALGDKDDSNRNGCALRSENRDDKMVSK